MAVSSQPRPRVKTSRPKRPPQRLVALGAADLGGGIRLLRLTIDGEPSAYLIRKIASQWGVAFEVEKILAPRKPDEPKTYHVNVDPSDPEEGDHTCECRGHLHHTPRTGKPCRHVGALLALIADGRLDGAPIRPAPAVCPCGEPAVFGDECLACSDAAADRAARRADCHLDNF
jgi:hypothetical protein